MLRLLAGDLQQESGEIRRIPSEMLVSYCPQRVDSITPEIRSFARNYDRDSVRMIGRLNLTADQLDRWDTLSPGERKRWQIATALVASPEMLLLDEPTNHLDSEAKSLLVGLLQSYRGIGVLVSHDRDLLDGLTSYTIRIVPGGIVKVYPGNYSAARDLWIREQNLAWEKRERIRNEQRKVKRRLEQTRRSSERADSAQNTGKRLKNIRDSDARSMAAKGRIASAAQKIARKVTVERNKLERIGNELTDSKVEKVTGRSVFVMEGKAPKSNLIRCEKERMAKQGITLIKNVRLSIRRDSRIHLRGPNGSGKTTLLETLVSESNLPPERVLYLPQELPIEDITRLNREIALMQAEEKGRLLQILAALGVPPERVMASEAPSPGEARKLKMAMGLSRQAWVLLLDEPTNHLDLPSIERIEEALKLYSGALLLVCHEAGFAEALTNESWSIHNKRILAD